MTRLRSWLLILAGGVILPISFCGFDQWYLTWIAFVPLLAGIEGASRRQALGRGFVYGLVANLIGYYWIPYTIHEFGHFSQVLAWTFGVILCSYQGVQYALLAYLTVRLRERGWPLLLIFPAIMVALETIYPLLFPIFMGNTQHKVPLLLQAADLLGPLLITAVLLLFNAALYVGLKAALTKEPIPWRQVAAGPAALALLVVYGAVRIPQVEAAINEGTELRVGIVQPSMGILEKWRDVEEGGRRHVERSLELEERGADLIIWSEAAHTAGYINPRRRNLRRTLVPGLNTPLLAGALTMHRDPDGSRRRHNSAIMLDAEGNVLGTYDKTYLLAFGEYLPFGDVFPQLYNASPNTGRLQPGTRIDAVPFEHEGERWSLGVLICYEDIIPQFTRELVLHSEPHLLVNMTNDAWFGDTNEPWIHMDLAKLRAIEHRRYLVRATNTGVSAVIDPVGRVVENTEVFVQASMLSTVRLLQSGPTIYALVGDLLGWLALALVVVGLVLTRKVWLRRPAAEGVPGLWQGSGVLFAIAVWDVLALLFVYVLTPSGWTPSALELLLWLAAIGGMGAAAVLIRRGVPRGLTAAWVGVGARLVLSFDLIAATAETHRTSVAALMGLPAALALAAAVTLWLWRERVGLTPARAGEDDEGNDQEKRTATPGRSRKRKGGGRKKGRSP